MIRWGIIGCGDVTEVKSGPGLQKATGSSLVAVMRRDGARAADYARRHGVPHWYDDARKLINDPEVDAVYIATPPGNHLEYALQVRAAGKPAYVEKPMARNHAECQRMIEAFDQARLPLFVAYYRRGLPRFIKTKELIAAGRIGEVTAVAYRHAQPAYRGMNPDNPPWRVRAEHSGGGLFLDLASHALDVLDYILGPIVDVSGRASNLTSKQEVEDVVSMTWRTESGAHGAAIWNFASDASEDTIEFFGTEGRISLTCFGNDPVRLRRGKETVEFDLPNPPHVQQPLIQSVVDELSGRGKSPSTGVSAARTSRVMDQALASYYGGRDDAFWSRPDSWPGRQAVAP